jgi:hypothetical protein
VRVQWVHPSWRDLVIEHLAGDAAAREHFLRSCGINGTLLALSLAGGAAGERERPLLTCDTDWDALTDRMYALVPALDSAETSALLALVADTIGATRSDRAEAEALARMLLLRLRRRWDASRAPIPLPELEGWLTLAEHLIPEPEPPSLDLTWAELLPACPPSLDDHEELERFADWLSLAAMLRDTRPDVLRGLGFRSHDETIERFLEAIEEARNYALPLSAGDSLVRALGAAVTFKPRYARGAETWLGAIGRAGGGPRRLPADDPISERRLFDVSRVLEDL